MVAQASTRQAWRTARSWSAVLLRCCLVLVAWQGPLPWFHAHVAAAKQPALEGWLRQHCQSRHAGQCDAACLGWHIHLDSPWDDGENSGDKNSGNQSRHAAPPRVPGSTNQLGADVLALADCFAGSPGAATFAAWSSGVREHSPGSLNAPTVPHQFWDGFAPTLALPVRLGVIRS